MKKLLFILLAWVVMEGLSAQNNDGADMLHCWKIRCGKCNCHKTSNMLWKWNFAMQGGEASFCMMVREQKLFILIPLCGDTIKVFESRKNYIIQELTDSTLIFQYLPDR